MATGRIAVRIYAPPGSGDAQLPALLYFHGGGWISGGIASHDAICATLSALGLCRVIAVDYRLAPEHRFPAALEDGAAALRAIAARPRRYGVDPRRLGIAGDSAGANLAVVLAREASAPLALQLLLCPVLSPLGRTPSRAALAAGWLIEEATMAAYWDSIASQVFCPTIRASRRSTAAISRSCRRRSFMSPNSILCATKAKPTPWR